MINGAHIILYSADAEADRGFLRDVLKLPNIDAGHGWLIFGLPPAEVAVHPSDESERHALFLMCADIDAFVRDMAARQVAYDPIQAQRWGLSTTITLPSGGRIGVYQPRHPRPEPAPGG